MWRSSRSRSGGVCVQSATTVSGSVVPQTLLYPSCSRIRSRSSTFARSSSTMMIRAFLRAFSSMSRRDARAQRLVDDLEKPSYVQGLGQELFRPHPQHTLDSGRRRVGADHDDRYVPKGGVALELLEHHLPVD